MFRINSLTPLAVGVLASLLLATTHAFQDCRHAPHDELLCENSQHWCPHHEIPVVFDFSEFHHRHYVDKLEIPGIPGYENKHIPVRVFGRSVKNRVKYYTPDLSDGKPHTVRQTNVFGGAARILDTATPDNDSDLGTPNQLYNGPGVGDGGVGTNMDYLGNVLFIQRRFKVNGDDTLFGGDIEFDFSSIKNCLTVIAAGLLDLDDSQHHTGPLPHEGEEDVFHTVVEGLGDNSFQEVAVDNGPEGRTTDWLKLTLKGSGALVYMKGCLAEEYSLPY